ncbi:MAG: MarR family winged helix-turn-helix transcriptional regulator [Marmoricola sp.]
MSGAVSGDSDIWLDARQQRAWRAYILGTTLLLDRLDRDLRQQHGLSLPEYEVLVRLSESPDRSMRMALLADAMCHSRSRVTHTVARLEKAGYVLRGTTDEDKRGVTASLTDHGMAVLREAAPVHVAGVREHLVDLASSPDIQAVGRVFDAVCDDLMAGHAASADIRREG